MSKPAKTLRPPVPASKPAVTLVQATQPEAEAPDVDGTSKGEQKILDALVSLEAVGAALPQDYNCVRLQVTRTE